jgi:hypothetical protein
MQRFDAHAAQSAAFGECFWISPDRRCVPVVADALAFGDGKCFRVDWNGAIFGASRAAS